MKPAKTTRAVVKPIPPLTTLSESDISALLAEPGHRPYVSSRIEGFLEQYRPDRELLFLLDDRLAAAMAPYLGHDLSEQEREIKNDYLRARCTLVYRIVRST